MNKPSNLEANHILDLILQTSLEQSHLQDMIKWRERSNLKRFVKSKNKTEHNIPTLNTEMNLQKHPYTNCVYGSEDMIKSKVTEPQQAFFHI